MKKNLLFTALAATTLLFATSCQQDEVFVDGNETVVTFEVGTPEIATRAFSKGEKATKLQYAVYDAEFNYVDREGLHGTIDFNKQANVPLQLAAGKTYKVLFWADAYGNAQDAPYTVDFAALKMNVNYTGAVCNDESRDAFYKLVTVEVGQANKTQEVTLTRPFAQLNIGTNDLDKLDGVSAAKTQVIVNVYNQLDLKTGFVTTGTTATAQTFTLADRPAETEAFPVDGYKYLAMNYLLVGKDKTVVDVEFSYGADVATAKTCTYSGIPVQPNYRTNIYGSLLTQGIDFDVEIEPDFNEPSIDNEYEYYEQDGVFVIVSANGLKQLAERMNNESELLDETIVLNQDIDLAVTTRATTSNWTPIGTDEKPFTGTFNGNGYSIKNLNIVESEAKEGKAYIGFFGYAKNATIKSVTFENVNLNIACLDIDHSQGHIGAVAGSLEGTSTIENVTVKGDIKVEATFDANGASRVAIVAGGNEYGNVTMRNVHVIANDGSYLKANNNVGALAGQLQGKSVFENCSSNIDVTGKKFFAGGIIGLAAGNQEFTNCHTTGNVTITAGREGRAHDQYRVGGIAGGWADNAKTPCILTNCSYTGIVSGTNADGSVANPLDYLGYVGRGYTLAGCQGSTVIINGIRFVQKHNTVDMAGIYDVSYVDGNEYVSYGVGKDDEGNYHIYNAAGMRWVAETVNNTTPYTPTIFDDKVVYLKNDIDLNNEEWIPIGDDRSQRTEFHGTFDGQGYTISNVKITKKTDRDDENKSSYGLFGNLKGTIKNLTVEKVSISGAPKFIGALVGRMNGGLIENCHVMGANVTCENWTIGGVVGQWNDGKISGCSIENSTIEGYAAVGALVGIALNNGERIVENCTVTNCTIKQNGNFGGDYDKMFGGILGATYGDSLVVNINNCKSDYTPICGYASEGDVVKVNGIQLIYSAVDFANAIKAGGEYALANDIALTEGTYENIDFTLDGCGFTIAQDEGSTNTYALFDSVTGKITLKNIVFKGIKGGAVIRTVGAETNIDNITVEDAEVTQEQGLIRLLGKSTITNSTFKSNTCNMVISLNYDGANNDPQVVENCVFENNTCNTTAVVYYVKGSSCTINNNKFVGNKVNTGTGNGATLYMGFTEDNTITNNIFKNNKVTTTGTSKRVSGGIMLGYETNIKGNAFVGNIVEGTNAKGNDVCASVYYTDIDLSGNYWGGGAPVENDDYFVEYPDNNKVIINDYLTTYEE